MVRLEQVRKVFGSVAAVDDVSLEIRPGEFLTLLGPSGSGKTTTLNIVGGFEFPTRGEVFVDEVPVTYVPPYKRDIGMVFQNYALFPHMTVSDNVAFPLRMRHMDRGAIRQKVGDILDMVRLTGLGHRYPRQLSGGQQQRVALARALVFRPAVLLMDEPLGALDKKLRGEMQLEIKHLQEQLRITVIYVTHDQEEALTMSDRVAVIHEGRIAQVGGPQELYEQPASRFVAEFIGESNVFEGQVIERQEDRARLRTPDGLSVWTVATSSIPVGTKALLSLRPERIVIGVGFGLLENAFEGVVDEVIYVGDTTRYRIRLREVGDTLTVKVQNVEAGLLRRGDVTRVGWSAEAGRLLP